MRVLNTRKSNRTMRLRLDGLGEEGGGGDVSGPESGASSGYEGGGQDADKADTVASGGTGSMSVDTTGSDASEQAQAAQHVAEENALQAHDAAVSAAQHDAEEVALAQFDIAVAQQQQDLDFQALEAFDKQVAQLPSADQTKAFSLLDALGTVLSGLLGGLPGLGLAIGKVAIGALLSGSPVSAAIGKATTGALINGIIDSFTGGKATNASNASKASAFGFAVESGLDVALQGGDRAGIADAIANGLNAKGFAPASVDLTSQLMTTRAPIVINKTVLPSLPIVPGSSYYSGPDGGVNAVYGGVVTTPGGASTSNASGSNSGLFLAIGLALLGLVTG